MRILVCVKQVPDIEASPSMDASGHWILRPKTNFRMNRFDEFAVEEALILKENLAHTTVDVLSVGPPRAQATIRRALEMGADNGIHILLPREGYCNPVSIAARISDSVRDEGYDLILCGAMSEDFMQAQVGPLLAEMLGLACVGSVIAVQPTGAGVLEVEQECEGGARQHFTVMLPALLCVQTGINRPRYPSLSNVLRAKRQAIATVTAAPIPPATGVSFRAPDPASRGVFLGGNPLEKARAMLRILHEHALV